LPARPPAAGPPVHRAVPGGWSAPSIGPFTSGGPPRPPGPFTSGWARRPAPATGSPNQPRELVVDLPATPLQLVVGLVAVRVRARPGPPAGRPLGGHLAGHPKQATAGRAPGCRSVQLQARTQPTNSRAGLAHAGPPVRRGGRRYRSTSSTSDPASAARSSPAAAWRFQREQHAMPSTDSIRSPSRPCSASDTQPRRTHRCRRRERRPGHARHTPQRPGQRVARVGLPAPSRPSITTSRPTRVRVPGIAALW